MDVVIIGAGKLGEYIAQNFSQFNLRRKLLGFVDDNPMLKNKKIGDLNVLGTVEDVLLNKRVGVILALETISEKIDTLERLASNPLLDYPNLFSSRSWISRECIVGKGNIILDGSLFNFGTLIGNFNTFSKRCLIGHETVIGDYCFFREDVEIGGYSFVENGCFFERGVTIIQGIRIGKNSSVRANIEIKEDLKPDTHLL